MANPALDPERRRGLLDAVGAGPAGEYQISDEDGAQVEPQPEAQPESTPAPAETAPEAAPAPEAQPEPQPEAEAAAETPAAPEQTEDPLADDLAFLDSLVPEEPSVAPQAPMSDSRITQLEQQLSTLKNLLGDRLGASAERIVSSPEATTPQGAPTSDLSQVDWTKPELLNRIQESLDMDELEARKFAEGMRIVGGVMRDTSKPELEALREKVSSLELLTTAQNQSRAVLDNLQSGVQSAQNLNHPMVRAVTNQFVTTLNSLGPQMNVEDARQAFGKSVLGRYLLQNKSAIQSATGVRDAILTVAMASEVRKRAGGEAETVMAGTREEVSAALGQAHSVDPSTAGEAQLDPEQQIRADMAAAAKEERDRIKKVPFFGGGLTTKHQPHRSH